VADFRPLTVQAGKVHREENDGLVLRLEKVPDILAELSAAPGAERVYRVGFAAEGEDLERRAVEKIERKRIDAIVANDIRRRDIAFGSEYNEAVMYFRGGERVELPRSTKRVMADRILDLVRERLP
jgi:phosphopantothenoylcysteine decarboxylase/phosphopantothenate--cysteine ligase